MATSQCTPPLLILLLAASCLAQDPVAPVVVENPERLQLRLFRVTDDESTLAEELADAARVEMRLALGAWWVEGRGPEGCTRVPLPLSRRAERPDPLRVTLRADPAPDEGWCFIPAGWSLRGDALGVGQEDERPARLIELPAFWISAREVTNREFVAFLDATDRTLHAQWINLASLKCRIERTEGRGHRTDAPDLPVVTVSWAGAHAYCAWLTRTTGRAHRLPTESEWEKAARGPESFRYGYGNVYTTAKANQESGGLKDVGSYAANGWGLHDVTGNAFEWVADAYDARAYAMSGKDTSPATSRPAEESAAFRVLRGGSFVLDGIYLRCAFRMRYRPTVQADDFGFRVLREIEKETR